MSSVVAAATTTSLDRVAFLASTLAPIDPPPGVTPNFDGPNTNGTVLVVISILGLILTTAITATRLWTKGVLLRALGWDDYMCVLTIVAIYVWSVTKIQLSLLGFGRHHWDLLVTVATWEKYAKLEYIANIAYYVAIGSVKVSILFLYLRTLTGSKTFKYTAWVLVFLIITSHVAGILVYALHVTPASCSWTIYPTDDEWKSRCKVMWEGSGGISYYVFMNALTVALDLVILYMPCQPVWRSRLAKRQRIAIMMILLAGVLVTIASILRLGYLCHRIYSPDIDDSWTEFQVNFTSTIELDVALLCCCLPALQPFMHRYLPSLLRLDNNSFATASSAMHANGTGRRRRKWPRASGDEDLVGSAYLELGEDGKSDRSYVMAVMPVKDSTDI